MAAAAADDLDPFVGVVTLLCTEPTAPDLPALLIAETGAGGKACNIDHLHMHGRVGRDTVSASLGGCVA